MRICGCPQSTPGHSRARRRIISEIARINLIHRAHVSRVFQIDAHLHDITQRQPIFLQRGLQIGKGLMRLSFNVCRRKPVLNVMRNRARHTKTNPPAETLCV